MFCASQHCPFMEKDTTLVLIRNFILTNYIPARSLAEASFTISSYDLYHKINDHFLCPDVTVNDIVNILVELDYESKDLGNSGIEWMMGKISGALV